VLYAARISLSVGFVGVLISFILGCILGGISGFFGGKVDMFIQRIIEFLISLPTIPIWMGLAAAVPLEWPAVRVYFMITVILSIVGWAGLARVVRGKILSLRQEDYVRAAVISGSRDMAVILRHLLPAFLSYLIVHLTLAIPGMILAETSLSFLGLGLRPPVISWGVLLKEAQNVKAIYTDLWLLIPGGFVMVTVLAFNFLGDGLRDAADPYR
jgi:peptide/nickel transport system permease protein